MNDNPTVFRIAMAVLVFSIAFLSIMGEQNGSVLIRRPRLERRH